MTPATHNGPSGESPGWLTTPLAAPSHAGQTALVIIVSGDPNRATAMAVSLGRLGYRARGAGNIEEGAELAAASDLPVIAVVEIAETAAAVQRAALSIRRAAGSRPVVTIAPASWGERDESVPGLDFLMSRRANEAELTATLHRGYTRIRSGEAAAGTDAPPSTVETRPRVKSDDLAEALRQRRNAS